MIVNLAEKILEVADHSKTLLQHFHDHRIDWMQSCGGKGRCTTCKAIIIEGEGNFGPLTHPEKSYRAMKALRDHERLSCQAKINGNIKIAVPEEYKLSHVRYSE